MESEAHREGDPVGDATGSSIPHSRICRNASEPARNMAVQNLMRAFTPAFLCCLLSCGGGGGKYTFTLNGKSAEPVIRHVYGDPGRTVAGDIALMGAVAFVLDAPGAYAMEHEEGRGAYSSILYRRLSDGSRRMIAADIDGGDIPSLTDAEWRGLRAVKLVGWSDAVVDKLQLLDAKRCHIKVGILRDGRGVERLPRDLGYFTPEGPLTEREEQALMQMTELVYLDLRRSLHCGGEPYARCDGPACCDVSYIARVEQLRTLHVDWTCIEDISALGGHPSLRHLSADNTPLQTLPTEPLPALRHLRAMRTNLDDAEVQRFVAHNPRCRVETGLVAELRDRVRNAARLRVLDGSSCHPDPDDPILYEGVSRAEVDELLELLILNEGFIGHFSIPGCGLVSIEFLDAQGRSLARVGALQSGTIRCPSVWPTFAGLQPDARRPFGAWLGERGAGWLFGS
jgi:hypothetical protein